MVSFAEYFPGEGRGYRHKLNKLAKYLTISKDITADIMRADDDIKCDKT